MAVLYSIAPENFPPAAFNNFPQYLSTTTGGVYRSSLAFDASISEKCRSTVFRMPSFIGTLTLKIRFIIASTTGNIQFRAAVEAITTGDALNMINSSSFDVANSSGVVSVPSTTYNPKDFIIVLTNNDSVAAGDEVTITLDRDVTVVSNAIGDCFITLVSLEDAS